MVIDEQLLSEIRSYVLLKTGKHYLGRIKSTSTNIMVSCPYHKDGQEQKPSMGIKLHTDQYGSVGTCHCFSCGIVTDLSSMVKFMLGNQYNEDEVEARFSLETTIARETILQETENKYTKFEKIDKSNYVYEDILKEYRTYHPYLKSRGIDEHTAMVYDIGYDPYNNHITFPIRDIYRQCVGLGRRAITEKQYIYPSDFTKPLYGVYELPFFIRHLWICEGPFNLWSLYQYGKSGVALLGTGTQTQYRQLLDIQCNDYILALDGDEAGHKGNVKLGKFLQQNGKKVYVADVPNGRDINDMTIEQFKNMIVAPFNEWKNYYKF